MKVKKEYIIISAIIIASVLYLVLRDDSKMNYEIPRFSSLEKDSISAVSIKKGENLLTLEKKGEYWSIEPRGFRASQSEVNRLLSETANLSIVDLISPRDDYSRYELDDDRASSITVMSPEGVVREFLLGKTSSSAVYTYIRLKDRKGVYSIRGNLNSIFSLSLDKWRDRQVLNFNSDEAAALDIEKEGKSKTLLKTVVTESPGWSLNGEILENSAEIDNHLKSLSILKTTGFVEEETGDPLVTIEVTTSSEKQTLQVFDKLEQGYAARSSYAEGVFMIPFYIGDMILDL